MNRTTTGIASFINEGLGHTSYLVDLGDGTALVIDPARLPDQQRAEADRQGLRIAYTADTHTHADYISGSLDLASGVGATFLAPADAGLRVPHSGLRDDDEIQVGALTLRAIATPGHTPDHLAYLLMDGDDPVVLFSGGSLMVGTVGRTDLLGAAHADELSRRLYQSLHTKILTLPDDLAVYPTHGAGSFCSAPSGGERVSTIGQERATNPLLAAGSEDEFVELLLDRLGTYPTYFSRMPDLNQQGPRPYDQLPTLSPLSPDDVESAVADGSVVVDVRPIEQYAEAHIPASLSIQLRPAFASWLGWLLEPETSLVFVVNDDQDHDDLVRQCLTIGFENLAGHLDGGLDTWQAADRPSACIHVVDPTGARGTILDVRQDIEYAAGHAPGAAHAELGTLEQAAVPSGPITTMCGHHERAMTGASVLERRGLTDLSVMRDGFAAWQDGGHPISVDG